VHNNVTIIKLTLANHKTGWVCFMKLYRRNVTIVFI